MVWLIPDRGLYGLWGLVGKLIYFSRNMISRRQINLISSWHNCRGLRLVYRFSAYTCINSMDAELKVSASVPGECPLE
jgi:hypothetical protein